ncbi:MAG: hypothetical protein HY598_00315, partial [Candidatus Omnitrophica bacterium]|nr:hypothetical protein [Candidatus Omnitrophota bacterium]
MDTQQSSTGSAVSQEQLNQLPTSRSYADLLTLVPGITNHKSSATDSVNWSRMPFSEGVRQAAQAIDPSALNELNVLSSNYSAPYSRLSGAPDVQGFSRYYLEDLARSREWPGEAAGMNGMLMATGKARGKERVAVLYDDEGYPIEYFTADDLKRHPDEVLEELHEMCDLISDGKLTVETGMLSSNKITTSSGKLYLDGYGDFMYGPPGVSLPLNVRNALAQPAYDLPKDYKLDLSLKRYAFGGGMQQLDPPTTPFGQQSLQQDAKPQKKEGVVTAPEVAEGLRDLGRKAGAGDKDAAKIIEGLGPFLTDGAKQELSRGVGEGVTSTPTTSGSPGGQQPQQGGAASTPRQEDSMPPLSPLRFPKLPVGGGMTQLDPPSTPSGQQTLQQDAKPVTPSPQVRVDGGSSSVTMPVDTTPEQPATAASDQPTESVLDDLGPGPTPPLHPQPEGEPTVKTASDGTTVRTFPDGTTERISPNGHTFVRYADNSTFERYPDGTAVDRAPDGSTTTRDKDGKVTGRTGATVIDLDRKVDRAVDRHMRMQRMPGEPSRQEQPPQRDKKRTTSKKVSPKKRGEDYVQLPPERDDLLGLTDEEARAGSAQALQDLADWAKGPEQERDDITGLTDEEARAGSAQALQDLVDWAKGPESGPGGVSQPDASWGEGAWWPLADPGTEPADPSWWREGGWWPLAES